MATATTNAPGASTPSARRSHGRTDLGFFDLSDNAGNLPEFDGAKHL